MNNALLEAKNITKKYNLDTKKPLIALNKVSLEVFPGEFLCIMGASGSGKSTLINNISSIDTPTAGRVLIDGEDITAMKESTLCKFRYQKLGFVFQDYNIIDVLTIFENISTPLSLHKVPLLEINERVQDVARKLNIEHTLDKYPSECSGGELQRVAIARAIVTRPRVIVADEPTGNLDSKNSHEILSIFKNLNEKENIAIVMVTHDSQIASYSSKLLFLKDGTIEHILHRETLSQKEYFYKIIDITSKDSQKLFE